MRPYRFLDTPCPEIAVMRNSITFYCVCDRYIRIASKDFEQWPDSSLHRIARRLKCAGCGARGDIKGVICNPEQTGPAWARL